MKQPRWIKEQLNRWKEIQMVRKVDKAFRRSTDATWLNEMGKPIKKIEYHYKGSNGYRGTI